MPKLPPRPPFVPFEHQNKLHSEMPEPYKSQIDEWLEKKTAWRKAQLRKMRFDTLLFVFLPATSILALCLAYFLNN